MAHQSAPAALIATLVFVTGCARGDAGPPDAAAEAAAQPSSGAPPTHVDSILPIEEELRRFRDELGPAPNRLSGGAASRDALIQRFVEALATSDTAAFADMLMTRDEFGWLYYPHTRYTSRPYEMAPALLWFQIENGTSRGIGRLLARLGGTSLVVPDYRCAPEPLVEERNLIWEECSLTVDPPEGEPSEMRLFGSILDRDGVFKFISYSNDF